MSMTTFPDRRQIERAGDLEFPQPAAAPRPGQAIAITIELAPDGLHIHCSYQGTLASIPAAVKRLQDAGLLDLVRTHSSTPTAPTTTPKAKAERVTPEYSAAGDACCPKHHKVLKQGQWGLYCPAKDDSTERGYCALKFAE